MIQLNIEYCDNGDEMIEINYKRQNNRATRYMYSEE